MRIDKTGDTISISGEKKDNFYTSTPKKACPKCYRKCVEKHHFGIHIEPEPDELGLHQCRLLDTSPPDTWLLSGLQQVAV